MSQQRALYVVGLPDVNPLVAFETPYTPDAAGAYL